MEKAGNRDDFFSIISRIYPSLDPRYKLILKAYNVAKDTFRHKKRESGERYFEHLRAVTLILIIYLGITDYISICAALLHDIVEDFPKLWSIERIRDEFGDEIALLVQYMTKPGKDEFKDEKDRLEAYHLRFEQAPLAFFFIKLADRLHNILSLGYCNAAKRKRKILETEIHYLPYARKHHILYYDLVQALQAVKTVKRRLTK